MAKRPRRVIRGGKTKGFKARALRFVTSFTPNNFRRYWLNEEGARRAAKIVGSGFLLLFLVFLYFAKDLPSPGKINAKIGSQNTVFYDRTGQHIIYEVHGDKNRRVIEFKDMPQNLKSATIAIEDKNFYHEGAFSVLGYLRAAVYDVTHRGAYQGGSTITQQYVKNALLDPNERSITRKIKELILSVEIDQLYKKDDILKLYLNEIPYGSQAYGIESACRTYFPQNTKDDKCAPNLSIQQSTLLAAIPNAPTYYSPYGEHTDDLIARQHLILDRMVEQKLISSNDARGAKLPELPLGHFRDVAGLAPVAQTQTARTDYPHFSLYAQEYLEQKYSANTVDNGGLKVITTLDLDKQKLAQAAIDNPRTGIAAVRRSGGSNVAMVSADPRTGQVLAMIGSYNANDPNFGAFNVALANRQPGSSFKPFVYATAMKGNWGPGSTIYDVVTDFGGGYKPTNYDSRTHGVQSVRTALDGSLNIPAVKMLYLAGIGNSIKTAHDLGISTLNGGADNYGLSLVLGSGEVKLNDMVNGYESFANGGVHYDATPILKVTDPHGKVIEDNSKPKSAKKVLDPQIAYLMANVLSDDKSRQYIFGANNPLHINGWNVGAKTGTTTGFKDAWTMGFSPDIITGVWAGNNDGTPMTNEAVNIAAPIWHDYMLQAMTKTKNPNTGKPYDPSSSWTRPDGIKTVTLDANTGKLPTPNTKATRTDIFPSWYKPENVTGTRTAKVDKVSGKLATDCTPAAAVEERTSSDISAEIPPTDPAYGRWQPPVAALAQSLGYTAGGTLPTDNDDVHRCSDVKPVVNVTSSGNGPLHISADVTSGTYPVNNLTIYFDDQIISTTSGASYSFDYEAPSTGSHTIKATVTDTALYSSSDETTVSVTNTGGGSGSGPPQAQSPSNGAVLHNNQTYSFSWDPGGGGPFTLFITRFGGSTQSYNVGGSSRNFTPNTVGSYSWYVQGAAGSSSPRSFTVVP